jgi:hypothetical protein
VWWCQVVVMVVGWFARLLCWKSFFFFSQLHSTSTSNTTQLFSGRVVNVTQLPD